MGDHLLAAVRVDGENDATEEVGDPPAAVVPPWAFEKRSAFHERPHARMVQDRRVTDAYRTPDERFEGLPSYDFAPHYVEQGGLRMHYLDEGDGAPVLLLHGEPTWAYLYRKVIPQVARVARCIAPDYLGFGRSDKPTAREWYSYDTHFASLERF